MSGATTRRALFASAAAATLIAAAPAVADVSECGRWDRAFGEWRRAIAHACAEQNDFAREAAWDREGEAWVTLIRMPAPHGRALLWKIAYVLELDGQDTSSGWSAEVVRPIMADARRLLGGAA